jgi:glucose/mannose transport system permease protein
LRRYVQNAADDQCVAQKGKVAMQIRQKLQIYGPQLLLAPSVILIAVCVYGFLFYTVYLSFTESRVLPQYEIIGFANYVKLWSLHDWWNAIGNWLIFAMLYIVLGTVLGLFLAILLDQRMRGHSALRPIFIYPMVISFIASGTVWKWLFDPAIGLEDSFHFWGWEGAGFAWIKDENHAILCVVVAALWQSLGLVMAIFLAAFQRIDNEVIKAAQLDGASTTNIYFCVVFPMIRPIFAVVFALLGHFSIKTYDLVIALTGGGPGKATEMPSMFMYSYTYERAEMAVGATSAVMMLLISLVLFTPVMYFWLKDRRHD